MKMFFFFFKSRLQKEERIREYEEKERERQLLKQKKQGLNELWLSGKSLVTIEDNPDIHDEDLLSYNGPQQVSESDFLNRDTNRNPDFLKWIGIQTDFIRMSTSS